MAIVKLFSDSFEASTALYTVCSMIAVSILYRLFARFLASRPIPGFPVVGMEKGEYFTEKAKQRFAMNGKKLIQLGLKQYNGKIFQFINHSGPALLVPANYLDEIRNNPQLDMMEGSLQDFFTEYPAFKMVKAGNENSVILHTVNKKLTPSLALITEPVNEENTIAMKELWPQTSDWTVTSFPTQLQLLISQVTSRIFLGEPICRNPQWIKIAKDYTVELMTSAMVMRYTSWFLRPFKYLFDPQLRKLRSTVVAARNIIDPEANKRRKARAAALARGEKIPKHLDTIDWMDEVSESSPTYDLTAGQLSLTFAAIHTTSNTLTHLLYDIIDHPELIPELRQEIINAYTEDGGWKKTTLFKLKLMDSVMKESQRVNVLGLLIITRVAMQKITLEDGTVIPKGTRLFVPTMHMHDETYYPKSEEFDGKRFLNLRQQPGNSNRYQFVTTSVEHIGFGHGQHSCPGRFFASNEIKLILAHLLMKYDWKFMDGRPKNMVPHGSEVFLDLNAKLLYKSRVSEVEF